MKVWVSKFALTNGVFEKEVEVGVLFDHIVSYKPEGSVLRVYLNNGSKRKEWHLTKEDAIKDAEARRAQKVAQLERQITKLRG